MPRAARSYEPNAVYHLTAHGVDERPIVRDDDDRQGFVVRLSRVMRRYGWRCYAICLMDTHIHLVISTRDGIVSPGMRDLNGGHSRAFNARHGRRGALFESRYRERYVRDDGHLLKTIVYVAMNPVRAGMVARPEDWTWGTYRQLLGLDPPWPCFVPGLVLAYFARDTLLAAVEEALRRHREGV